MTKVLMVCLGNICRSPLAEGVLKSLVDSQNIYVDSAGTGGYHIGALPDERSIAVAKKHHIDITDQRARKFKYEDLNDFDHIFVMDRSNLADVLAITTTQTQVDKVKLLLDQGSGSTLEVPDPYYGGDDGFDKVYALVYEACQRIAKQLS